MSRSSKWARLPTKSMSLTKDVEAEFHLGSEQSFGQQTTCIEDVSKSTFVNLLGDTPDTFSHLPKKAPGFFLALARAKVAWTKNNMPCLYVLPVSMTCSCYPLSSRLGSSHDRAWVDLGIKEGRQAPEPEPEPGTRTS